LTGISLTIPQGAVPQGETFDIYLAVSRDDKDRPKLTGKGLSSVSLIYFVAT
jgi:hypothetical protein